MPADQPPATCTSASCQATRAEYDRDPCTRQICPMHDAQPATVADHVEPAIERVTDADAASALRAVDGREWATDATVAGPDDDARCPICGHRRSWHRQTRCVGDLMSCECAAVPLLAELAEAQAQAASCLAAWQVDHAELAEVTRERDKARATVERINAMVGRWCDGASSHYPSRLIAEIVDELAIPPDPTLTGRETEDDRD